MSSNSQLNVSSLFRSLKPESANAESMDEHSSKKAAQRWPLLQSLPPTKWPLTPSLNDAEMQARRIDCSAEQNLTLLRKPENLVPSIDLRIAEGLDRLFTRTKPAFENSTLQPSTVQPPQIQALPATNPISRPSLFSQTKSEQTLATEKPAFKSLFSQANSGSGLPVENLMTTSSIQTILARIENVKRQDLAKMHGTSNTLSSTIKPPGFFARLGKR
jgi:hypothetical protein